MSGTVDMELLMSGASLAVTAYFWLIKARKDLPHLQFYQLNDFRVVARRHPHEANKKRICIQQLNTGGVLAVNHSTRQNSIVFFECYLQTADGDVLGDWGYGGNDNPPWNVGPETTIPLSPACFFDVPEDFEIPDDPVFRMHFVTASGKQFVHQFRKHAPRLATSAAQRQRAA